MSSKNIKQRIGEIAVCTVVLAILLTILIPTISKCLENGSENKCRKRLELITAALNTAVKDQENSEKWVMMFDQKNSRRLLDTLKLTMKPEAANRIDTSEYYIKSENGRLYVRCVKHPKIDDYFVKIPEGISVPDRLAHVLEFVKGDKIIAAHLGGWKDWDRVEQYLVGTPIFLDTAFTVFFIEKEQLLRIIRNHGSEKILFATDSPWEDQGKSAAAISALPLNPSDLENILYKNAQKILKLSETY